MCLTCAVGLELLPAYDVGDVVDGDVGVQRGVIRHLGLVDVGAVAYSKDVCEAFDLHVVVDLQGTSAGH